MYVDSHVHLQPHGEQPPMTLARIERYVEAGRGHGVTAIAVTEHLFRFREAFELLAGWWEHDPDPTLARLTHEYWRDHVSGTMAEYARTVEAAKAAGLPVLLGIELDWIAGRSDDLRALLAPYDWDIVLGSVHWIGAWGFDQIEREEQRLEWGRRDTDAAFEAYASLLRDLAAGGLCDVLAHPDLPKIAGHRPRTVTPLHTAIVESAAGAGCAVEINSNGYNKPCAEPYPALPVLERARQAGLAITLGSDAHWPERVGERFDDLAALAARAGYEQFVTFEARRAVAHALPAVSKQ